MSVSVSCSLAYVEQGRSTCFVSRFEDVRACVAETLARAFLFARRSVASSSFLLRNVAMSQSGSQAVCRVSRRVSRTVSQSLRFIQRSQISGRNRLRFAWRSSPKKPPESRPKSTQNRSREAPGAPKIDQKPTLGHPGRFRVVTEASRSVPGAPRSVPRAPWGRSGAPQGSVGDPKWAPRRVPSRPGACKITPKWLAKAKKT